MRRTLFVAVVFVLSVPTIWGQFSLGLPRLDAITVFYRAGRLSSSSAWEGVPTAPCGRAWSHNPACGWGFETMYDLTTEQTVAKQDDVDALRNLAAVRAQEVSALEAEADAMDRQARSMLHPDADRRRAQARAKRARAGEKELEVKKLEKEAMDLESRMNKHASRFGAALAVGYDYVNIHARPRSGGNYDILGSIQTLPSITLYTSWNVTKFSALYAGIGTGFVVLKNMRAYDATGRAYAISGDTWGLTPRIGWARDIRPETTTASGLYGFVEVSYEVRQFPSLNYTLPDKVETLPTDLPRSVSASGFVLNVGMEIRLPKSDKK